MLETMPAYMGLIIIIVVVIDIVIHWPTPRKILEYDNKSLREENKQNNSLIHDLQLNIESMRNKENDRDKEIEDLHQIINILAKAQGIKDWRKELKK